MTYEEMKAQAERVARALRGEGGFDDVEVLDVKPGEPIDIVYTDMDAGDEYGAQFVLSLDLA